MIEIHGWAVIKEAYRPQDEDEQLFNTLLLKIEEELVELNKISNEVYTLKCLNGQYHLTLMVNHNHRSEHVIDFFKWLAKTAIGSYGLLYVQDDEDIERNNSNQFKVWTMKKGEVTEQDDLLLSPFNPTVEEY